MSKSKGGYTIYCEYRTRKCDNWGCGQANCDYNEWNYDCCEGYKRIEHPRIGDMSCVYENQAHRIISKTVNKLDIEEGSYVNIASTEIDWDWVVSLEIRNSEGELIYEIKEADNDNTEEVGTA